MSTAPEGVSYGFGRDYTNGYGHETHFEKIEKLGKFMIDKINHALQDVRLGCERIGEIYSMDFAIDAEPACTNMNRMLVKSTACSKKIKAIEGLLTNNKQPSMPKYVKKEIPRSDEVENVVNEWLEKMDINASIIEDSAHAINEKCEMNLRLEPKMEDPYLDMKQFIQSVIRKYQRVAFGWMMVQIMIITNNIDIERASPTLLTDAQNLKALYDNAFITAEEYADRRLQILDKMFMRQKDTDREDRMRWMSNNYNLKDLYNERKVALPDYYDRDGVHKEIDYYDPARLEDEEARRIRKLALVDYDANEKINTPVLLNNNVALEVEKRRFKEGAGRVVEKNVANPNPPRERPTPRQDFGVASTAVYDDVEARKKKFLSSSRQRRRDVQMSRARTSPIATRRIQSRNPLPPRCPLPLERSSRSSAR